MRIDKQASRGRSAGAAAASEPSAVPTIGGHTLTLQLAGRICLATHEGRHVALFLDTEAARLGFRPHRPLVRAAMDDCTQEGADLAKVSFADQAGRVQAVWDLTGCDLEFTGLMSSAEPVAEVDALPDLRAVFAAVNAAADWRVEELFDRSRLPAGTLARLWLTGFERIDTLDFDAEGVLREPGDVPGLERTFFPGGHSQRSHAVIRCTGKFRELASDKPTLVVKNEESDARQIPFDDTSSFLLTFSNLCTCIGTDRNTAPKAPSPNDHLVLEDEEFAVYYELLRRPPAKDDRPVPFVPEEGAGAGSVVQCVPTARLR